MQPRLCCRYSSLCGCLHLDVKPLIHGTTTGSGCPCLLLSQKGNFHRDFMLLLSSKGLSVREAGAIFIWPPRRHRGHPFPLAAAICIHSSFEFLSAGPHFLPNGQGIHAHSVAGVRWQSLAFEDTKASLSASPCIPPPLLRLSASLLFAFQASARFQRSNKMHQAGSIFFFF